MASVLKEHDVGAADKVSIQKVEVLLNSVLKELQNEKLRQQQLNEQSRRARQLLVSNRRNLLCCEPGAFVQWMAWYNLSRSHRDHPMKDRDFMRALAMDHPLP